MIDATTTVRVREDVQERELAHRVYTCDNGDVVDLTLWWYTFDGDDNHTYIRWVVNDDNDGVRSKLVDPKLAFHAFTHPNAYGVSS